MRVIFLHFCLCLLVLATWPGRAAAYEDAERRAYRYSGGNFEQPLLVVRVGFTDILPAYSEADVESLFFASRDSVRRYYLDTSSQQFQISPAVSIAPSGVVDVTLPYPHPDFGRYAGSGNSRNLVMDVLVALDEAGYGQAFADYDHNRDGWLDANELALVLLVAGYEQAVSGSQSPQPNIWAHQGLLAAGSVGDMQMTTYVMAGELQDDHLATIGLICHELGHLLLGLPDLVPEYGIAEGVGRRGLMALGGWNTDVVTGDMPSMLLPWSREVSGLPVASGVTRIDLDPYRHGRYVLVENRPHPITSVLEPVLLEVDGRAGLARLDNTIKPVDNRQPMLRLASGSAAMAVTGFNEPLTAESLASLGWSDNALVRVTEHAVIGGVVAAGSEVADSGWAAAYSGEIWQQVVPLGEIGRWQWLDGMDVLLLESGSLTLEVLDPDSGALLATGVLENADAGWNRWLLPEAIAVPASRTVVVLVRMDNSTAVVASQLADGAADNNWRGDGELWQPADRRLMLAALVRATVASPDTAEDPDIVDDDTATDSGSSGGGSSGGGSSGGGGGGFMSPLWLVPVWWIVRHRQRSFGRRCRWMCIRRSSS